MVCFRSVIVFLAIALAIYFAHVDKPILVFLYLFVALLIILTQIALNLSDIAAFLKNIYLYGTGISKK